MTNHALRVRPSTWWGCGLLGSLTLIVGCGFPFNFQGHRASKEVSHTIEFQADTMLTVNSRNGAIIIRAEPDATEVRIEASITCGGSSEEIAQQRVEVAEILAKYKDETGLTIEPVFPDKLLSGDSASITVITPAANGIQARSSNGPVTVEGVDDSFTAELVVQTSNASVTVSHHQGPAKIDTTNGPVQVADIDGGVIVDTSNSSVTANSVTGKLQIESSNGPVRIQLRGDQSGPIIADTSNSPVSVTLGDGFQGKIVVDTSNARVRLEDPSDRVTENKLEKKSGFIVVGNDTNVSHLDTSNAPIKVTLDATRPRN